MKLRRLVKALDDALADDDDVCFLDFMSLPQAGREKMPDAYFVTTGAARPLADRTPEERTRFSFAMWEMSRLYAYVECHVLVLPESDPDSSFPGGPDLWGLVSPNPYYRRGWTTSEYAIAKLNNRIVNTGDLAVRQLDDSRDWPSSVEEYMHMMRDDE